MQWLIRAWNEAIWNVSCLKNRRNVANWCITVNVNYKCLLKCIGIHLQLPWNRFCRKNGTLVYKYYVCIVIVKLLLVMWCWKMLFGFMLSGRFDVALPHYFCQSCNHFTDIPVTVMIGNGFWPSSPVLTSGKAFFVLKIALLFKPFVVSNVQFQHYYCQFHSTQCSCRWRGIVLWRWSLSMKLRNIQPG